MIPKRIVLDTNVCLDLFVFHDARWTALKTALAGRTLEAVTRADCRREWLIVLDYPHLPLNDASRAQAVKEFDTLVRCLDLQSAPEAPAEPRLPVCKDSDDQKFLELARDASAEALITKDKALLKLARRALRDGFFLILPPEKWSAVLDAAPPAGTASIPGNREEAAPKRLQ